MKPPPDTSWIKMDNARRVSRTSVWVPILVAACTGLLAALAVAVVVALSWRPEGIGM